MNQARKVISTGVICMLGLTACQTTRPLQELPQQNPSEQSSPIKTPEMTESLQQKSSQPVSSSAQSAIQGWTMQGAMAVRHPKKSWTASFNWNQSGPSNYHIRLFGPLGSGTVLIDGHNGLTTYQDGPKKLASKNANALLKQQTGVALPVHNLYYWARGIPAPGAVSFVQKGPSGAYAGFAQAGYKIEYPEYIKIQGTVLPRQIKLTGNGTFIKVVIKHWRL